MVTLDLLTWIVKDGQIDVIDLEGFQGSIIRLIDYNLVIAYLVRHYDCECMIQESLIYSRSDLKFLMVEMSLGNYCCHWVHYIDSVQLMLEWQDVKVNMLSS